MLIDDFKGNGSVNLKKVNVTFSDNQKVFQSGIILAQKHQELAVKEVRLLIKHKFVANSDFLRYTVLNSYPENTHFLSGSIALRRYAYNEHIHLMWLRLGILLGTTLDASGIPPKSMIIGCKTPQDKLRFVILPAIIPTATKRK